MKLAIITPVDRYLGFSAPVSPVEQFNNAVKNFTGVEIVYVDPQRTLIYGDYHSKPILYDNFGKVLDADVYFAFSHTPLDRQMTRYIIKSLESAGAKVINGYQALTVADDKALMAIELAGSGLPIAQSFIASARSNSRKIIDILKDGSDFIISKTSGLTAGGVGVRPIAKDINYLAPELWSCRLSERPKVIQNDLDAGNDKRMVIRTYVIGGQIAGSYTTTGYGVVNCAGLTRESKVERYNLLADEASIVLDAASAVYSSGFCRVDCVGGKNFSILEVNPVARIDALDYGIDVPSSLIKYARNLCYEN